MPTVVQSCRIEKEHAALLSRQAKRRQAAPFLVAGIQWRGPGDPRPRRVHRARDLERTVPRAADDHAVAGRVAGRHRRRAATTEDLRKAMVYYRELFQDLLEDRERVADRAVERPVERELATDEEAARAERARIDNERRARVDRDVRP